jgi:predicted nucleic acid-binding protein
MMQGRVVDLDAHVALTAAQTSLAEQLPMADSIILTTARLHQATLWTQDEHFQRSPGGTLGTRILPFRVPAAAGPLLTFTRNQPR